MPFQFVSFGPVYLDFIVRQQERIAPLMYGTERILQSHIVGQETDSFSLLQADAYNGSALQLSLHGSVEKGSAKISIDGVEANGTYETVLGGSTANFAGQLKRLGLNPLLVGVYGNDSCGRRVRDLLQGSLTCRLSEADAMQTVSINVLHPVSQEAAMITSGGSNRQLTLETLLEAFSDVVGPGTFLYAGGFFKQEHLFPYYAQLFREARLRGATVILDHGRFLDVSGSPKFLEEVTAARSALQYVDIYLPNKQEIEGLTGKANVEDALKEAAGMGPGLVVCKLGAEGASFIEGTSIDTVPHEGKGGSILSLVGAGDIFNAVLMAALNRRIPVKDALRLANVGAYQKITTGLAPTFGEVTALVT